MIYLIPKEPGKHVIIPCKTVSELERELWGRDRNEWFIGVSGHPLMELTSSNIGEILEQVTTLLDPTIYLVVDETSGTPVFVTTNKSKAEAEVNADSRSMTKLKSADIKSILILYERFDK